VGGAVTLLRITTKY